MNMSQNCGTPLQQSGMPAPQAGNMPMAQAGNMPMAQGGMQGGMLLRTGVMPQQHGGMISSGGNQQSGMQQCSMQAPPQGMMQSHPGNMQPNAMPSQQSSLQVLQRGMAPPQGVMQGGMPPSPHTMSPCRPGVEDSSSYMNNRLVHTVQFSHHTAKPLSTSLLGHPLVPYSV